MRVFLEKNDEALDLAGGSQTSVAKSKAETLYDAIIEMEDLVQGIQERTLQSLEFDVSDDVVQV